MIKLLKLVSYLSVILAICVSALAGIGLTRKNDIFQKRADFLGQPTVIEKLREVANLSTTKKDKVSPLVTQAIKFALRIEPPLPPNDPKRTEQPVTRLRNTDKPGPIISPPTPPIKPATYKLVGICRYVDYPEKSLAMLDITSEGLKWFRQGDKHGRNVFHQINDDSVVIYQNGRESSILELPKVNTVNSLLKSSGVTSAVTVDPTAAARTTMSVPVRRGPDVTTKKTITTTPSSYRRPKPGNLTTTRRPGPKPMSEEERKALEKDTAEIASILEALGKTRNDGTNTKNNDDEKLNAILKILERDTKKPEPKKKDSK